MAVHKQVDLMLQKANETIDKANEQLDLAKRVEQGNPIVYAEAQLSLQEMSDELSALVRSATPEQRDQLHRAQQRVREMLNQMILK